MKNSLFKDETGNISSKRIFGAILIIFSMYCAFIKLPFEMFLVTGASLIGVGTIEKFAK